MSDEIDSLTRDRTCGGLVIMASARIRNFGSNRLLSAFSRESFSDLF
jgi:hypothetical protein